MDKLAKPESIDGGEEKEDDCIANANGTITTIDTDSVGSPLETKRKGGGGLVINETGNDRKKQRVVWTSELHKLFVDAVNYFGLENAVPKKIMERMNVPDITRENVASHLQKYRQLFKKRQEGNAQEKKSGRKQKQQPQQHCEPNAVKPNQDVIQTPHEEHDVNVDAWANSMVQDPILQNPTHYDMCHSTYNPPDVDLRKQQQQQQYQLQKLLQQQSQRNAALLHQPSYYEQYPNLGHSMYYQHPNLGPHNLIEGRPLPYVDSSNMSRRIMGYPNMIPQHNPHSNSGFSIKPKIELNYSGMTPYSDEQGFSIDPAAYIVAHGGNGQMDPYQLNQINNTEDAQVYDQYNWKDYLNP